MSMSWRGWVYSSARRGRGGRRHRRDRGARPGTAGPGGGRSPRGGRRGTPGRCRRCRRGARTAPRRGGTRPTSRCAARRRGGRLGPGPVHLPGPGLEGVGQDELAHGVVDGVAEAACGTGAQDGVVRGERQLVGGAADLGLGHERVRRVHHRRLRRPGEELGGMVEVPLVELVVAGHEHRRRRLEGPAGPAGLLPERRQRAREPVEHDGVEAGHVDAELQRVGGGDAEQLALGEGRLQLRGAPRARYPPR